MLQMESKLCDLVQENMVLKNYVMQNTQAAAAVSTTAVGAACGTAHAVQVAA